MSYITHELVAYSDYNDFFVKLKTYFQEAGWTLEFDGFDGSDPTTQNFVVSSMGESGEEPKLYMAFYYYDLSRFHMQGTAGFTTDGSTYTLTYLGHSFDSDYLIDNSAGGTMWFYGDKDAIMFVAKKGTDYYDYFVTTKFEPFFGENINLPNASSTDGSTTTFVVNSGDETKFDVGTWQNIEHPNGTRLVKKITAIDTVNHSITFDTSFTLDGGGRMGFMPYTGMYGNGGTLHTLTMYGYTNDDNYYTNKVYIKSGGGTNIGYSNFCYMVFMKEWNAINERHIEAASSIYDKEHIVAVNDFRLGVLPHFVMQAPEADIFNHEDVLGVSEKDSGTASSGTTTTLVDSTKVWGTDAYADKYLVITNGTGAGQVRKITLNTSDTLTIPTWNVTPDNTSTYIIVEEAYRYFKQGNEVAVKIG